MSIVVTKPPVSAKGIELADAQALAEAISGLADGEFASDGKGYKDRSEANAVAAKYVRVIESRYDVKLRSRTWKNEAGEWTFGLRAKAAEAAPAQSAPTTPEPEGGSAKKK